MASIFWLILVIGLVVVGTVDEKWYPRLMSSDGNLIIRPAKNRNITLDFYGSDSYINIGPYEVLHLLSSAERAVQTLSTLEQSKSISPNVEIQKLRNTLNGKNGVLRRLSRLERRNTTRIYGNGTKFFRKKVNRLQSKITRIENMLMLNECQSTPCKNGGTCIDGYNHFICLCPDSWQGNDCTTDVDECVRFANSGLGCQNGAKCKNKDGGYDCDCSPGWYGIHCTLRTSNCVGNDNEQCGHGICRNSTNGGSFTCECAQGWTTDGVSPACTKDIDECAIRSPCSTSPFVPCINVPGSFYCGSCPTGYTGNGYTCMDINECLTDNGGCSSTPLVQCINTMGYRICGPCPPGFEGDGTTCTYKGLCQVNNGGCHPLAVCSENPTISWTYVRCLCPAGYTGHGYGVSGCILSSSSDVSVVVTEVPSIGCSPNPCVHGNCVNTPKGHLCVCFDGFAGRACEMLADACSIRPCKNGGTCIKDSSRGPGYRCECTSQYTGRRCQNAASQCGNVFDTEEGHIIYPEANSTSYGHNSRCAWVIKTKSDMVLNVTFDSFNLEQSTDCLFDWLQIHDGRNSADRVIGRYCGNTLPHGGNIITTTNSLYFWFRSDHTVARNGFSLRWTSIAPVCGGEIETSSHGSISSPGSPGKYPPNRDCFWIIQAPSSKRILLHFFTMQIKSDPDCSNDYLEIREGHEVTDPLLMKHCNYTVPPPFTSPGPELLIHFHSDQENSDYGFQMTYAIVEGIPGCGGVYTQDKGDITPPMANTGYASSVMCEYLIRLNTGLKVGVNFLNFDVEYSADCQFDYLAAYDGPTTDSKLIGKYCGSSKPSNFVSTTNTLLLVFESDFSFSGEGFRISYKSVCRESFREPTGIITSPNYPKDYGDNIDCTYSIIQPPKKAIIIDFLDFLTEENISFESCTDYIEISDFGIVNHTLGQFCGEKIPDQIISSSNALSLFFHTDDSIGHRGFKANYSVIDLKTCGAVLMDETGTIQWPQVPEDEWRTDETSCSWIIILPGYSIQLQWLSFEIDSSMNCNSDYVEIKDDDKILGKYCGNKLPPHLTSSAGKLNITMFSEFGTGSNKFSLSYTAIDQKKVCGGYHLSSYGSITSPGWPDPYPHNKDCIWTIQVPEGQQIQLNFTTFSLENFYECNADYLEIRNGGFQDAPLIGKYCSDSIPKRIPSISNTLYLRFHSDRTKNSEGFHVTWESTATGCGGVLTSFMGAITSPNYPQPYGNNVECYWKISTSLGSRLSFIFTMLDLEKQCFFDYVELFDSIDTETRSLGRFCTTPIPTHIISSSNHVFIKFRSDISLAGAGFIMNYLTICNDNITGYTGVIESPNFPNEYPGDFNCTWKITVPKGNRINITFSHFSLEKYRIDTFTSITENGIRVDDIYQIVKKMTMNNNCTADFVELRDGSAQHSNDRRYCGDKTPPRYTTTGNVAFVNFKTDDYLQFSGFRLEWNIVGCGGYLRRPFGLIETPGYPNKYPANTECRWTVEVEPDKSVRLVITEFNGDASCSDYVTVYDGQDIGPVVLTNLCNGKVTGVEVTSSGRYMHVIFNSDDKYSGRGFKATYVSVDSNCGGKYINMFGTITSMNYPNNYAANTHCFWEIETIKDQRVLLEFNDFDLNDSEENITCPDSMNIYDGNQPLSDNAVVKNLCGNKLNTTSYISKSNKMLVEMITTAGYAKGFKATYSTTCGSIINAKTEGIIKIESNLLLFQRYNTCTWTIIADEPAQKISLTFRYLKLTDSTSPRISSYCDKMKISVYNGESNKAPLVREICDNKSPPTIVSGSNAITFELVNSGETLKTFEAHYNVMSTACGGDLLSEHGSFTSPMYPNLYPPNAECVWRLLPSPGNRIMLTFVEFDIAVSDNCDQDYLEVREENGAGKILGIYCGNEIPTNNTVGNNVWVKFRADSDGASKGFLIDYSYLHGNEIFGNSGTVTNPMYPKAFEKTIQRDDFFWRINVPFGSKIRVTFKEIFMASLDECDELNSIYVHDGYSEKNRVIATACGYNVPEPVESASNIIYITWSSNGVLGSKFKLEWTSIEVKAPQELVKDENVCSQESDPIIFISPDTVHTIDSPQNKSDYFRCMWKFETDSFHHLTIRFVTMNNFPRDECMIDRIRLLSGWKHNPDSMTQIAEICSPDATKKPYDAGNRLNVDLEIYFKRAASFSALVYAGCGGNVTSLDGVLTPSFPNVSNFNIYRGIAQPFTCEWSVKVRSGRTIQLHFLDMNITNTDSGVCTNYVMVRNGASSDSPILGKGKYCGDETPSEPLETISNYLYVKYSTSLRFSQLPKNTFKLQYNEKSISCDYRLTLTEDQKEVNISSPNYPNIPSPYTMCTWVIMAPIGERIKVHFIERFDLTLSMDCGKESVEVRDGGTELSESLGKFCTKNPPTLKTTNNIVYISFITDLDEPKNGFKATISIDICGGTIHASSGSISLPKNLPIMNQKSDVLCEWNIIGATSHSLWVNIRELNIPFSSNCTSSYFQIMDIIPVNGSSYSLTDRVCTLDKQLSVRTMSEHAILKLFISKQTMRGFHYNLLVTFNSSLSTCGGTLTTPEGFLFGPSFRSSNLFSRFCNWRIQVPKGRRVTLDVLGGLPENYKIHQFDLSIAFYNDFEFISIIKANFSGGNTLVESSDNKMMVYYWSRSVPTNQFRAHYTSEKESLCDGEFSLPTGAIGPPAYNSREGISPVPYYCEYIHNPMDNLNMPTMSMATPLMTDSTLTLTMKNVAIGLKTGYSCKFGASRISVSSPGIPLSIQDFCGNYSTPIIVRASHPMTKLSILDGTGTASYSITYQTVPCGGTINNVDSGYELKIPAIINGSIDCVWVLMPPHGGTLKVNTKNVKLTGPCEEEYIWFRSNIIMISSITAFCSTNVTSTTLKPLGAGMRIEYHSDRYYNETKLDIEIISKTQGCGGMIKNKKDFSTPNFPSNYGENEECIWEIVALPGYRVTLFFENRFSLEKSNNCTKDFVEVFDGVNSEWSSIGKFCGREMPKEMNSTSNTMKVIFRSDGSVNGDGFKARWKTFCGGEMDVTYSRKTLTSPGYPLYTKDLNCVYKLKPPLEKSTKLTFEAFSLEDGRNGYCEFDNLTIKEFEQDEYAYMHSSKTFCGTEIPKTMLLAGEIHVIFQTDRWMQRPGFIMHYEIDECGAVINSSQKISTWLSRNNEKQISKGLCYWNITAPPSMIVLLRFEKFELSYETSCENNYLVVYDGYEEIAENTIAKLCGNHSRSLPVIKSNSNHLLMRMASSYTWEKVGFDVDVSFTYGELYGCGGGYKVVRKTPVNFGINQEKLYKPLMDCHWIISTNKSDIIVMKFNSFHIAPCAEVNQTSFKPNQCSCDYLEVRDGFSFIDPLIGRYCGHDLPRTISSSGSHLWVRFVTDSTIESAGVEITFTSAPSVCGDQVLQAEENVKKLSLPKDSDGNVMKGISCMWKINGEGNLRLKLKNVDLSPMNQNGHCVDDKLELSTRSNINMEFPDNIPKSLSIALETKPDDFTYIYCGQVNGSEYHITSGYVYVSLITSPNTEKHYKGFNLEYSKEGCSRNYTNDYGTIKYSQLESNCTIIIQTGINKTIALYIKSLFSHSASVVVKDGISADSQTLSVVDQYVKNPVFSTNNILRIEIDKKDFYIYEIDMMYITTDKGKGCGGSFHIENGRLTSPLYPLPYREAIKCEWEITTSAHTTVSVEFKVFDLGAEIPCEQNYVELLNRDGSSIAKYCPRADPAIRKSNSNYLKIVQQASINNKGTGWMLDFQAVYE